MTDREFVWMEEFQAFSTKDYDRLVRCLNNANKKTWITVTFEKTNGKEVIVQIDYDKAMELANEKYAEICKNEGRLIHYNGIGSAQVKACMFALVQMINESLEAEQTLVSGERGIEK